MSATYKTIMYQLTCGLISETSVPDEFMDIPEIADAIAKYKWRRTYCSVIGWTNLIRVITYPN